MWCLFWDELPPSHPVSSLSPPPPLCLSLRSCPQTSPGLPKESGVFFFFVLNAEPVSRERIIWPTLPPFDWAGVRDGGSPPHTSGGGVSADVCDGELFTCDTSALEALLLSFGLLSAATVERFHALLPIFSPVDSTLSARCVSASLPPPPLLILSPLQESSFQHLTFNPLIPPMQSVRRLSTASNWCKPDL